GHVLDLELDLAVDLDAVLADRRATLRRDDGLPVLAADPEDAVRLEVDVARGPALGAVVVVALDGLALELGARRRDRRLRGLVVREPRLDLDLHGHVRSSSFRLRARAAPSNASAIAAAVEPAPTQSPAATKSVEARLVTSGRRSVPATCFLPGRPCAS